MEILAAPTIFPGMLKIATINYRESCFMLAWDNGIHSLCSPQHQHPTFLGSFQEAALKCREPKQCDVVCSTLVYWGGESLSED